MWKTKKFKMLTATLTAVCMLCGGGLTAFAAQLIPVGSAVGIEATVDGALVEELSTVAVDGGSCCPAGDAGVKAGDVITHVNGSAVHSLEEFAAQAQTFDGSPVALTLQRGAEVLNRTVTPVRGIDGRYQVGLWLRDLVAGVGTVTYYNPKNQEYGALGHGINHSESGAPIPIHEGVTYDAAVVDVVRGQKGDPGELTGSFDSQSPFGTVGANTVYGIFGTCTDAPDSVCGVMETAALGEAHTGAAEILSTVEGSEPRLYDIRIDKVQRKNGEERYQFTVTDPALLEITGGVVCGMSGSPILQDGKLVGAVTHVLVNDPTRGYGIFIENMLEAAE